MPVWYDVYMNTTTNNTNRCNRCHEILAPANYRADIDLLIAEHVAAGECIDLDPADYDD